MWSCLFRSIWLVVLLLPARAPALLCCTPQTACRCSQSKCLFQCPQAWNILGLLTSWFFLGVCYSVRKPVVSHLTILNYYTYPPNPVCPHHLLTLPKYPFTFKGLLSWPVSLMSVHFKSFLQFFPLIYFLFFIWLLLFEILEI